MNPKIGSTQSIVVATQYNFFLQKTNFGAKKLSKELDTVDF